GEVRAVGVREPAPVRDEVEALTAWAELGVDVLGALEEREDADLARLEVEEREARLRRRQALERRARPAVRGEGERPPVRAPRRLDIHVTVVCELAHRAAFDVHDVEVRDAAPDPRERDAAAVRAPPRVLDRADAADADAPLDLARAHVEDRDLVVPLDEHDEGELLAVRPPRPGRGDEAERVEVAVSADVAELLEDLAGLGVGE